MAVRTLPTSLTESARNGVDRRDGNGPVTLDTVIFIYFIEEHPRYRELLKSLFTGIDNGRISAVTSALTLLETLVVPTAPAIKVWQQDMRRFSRADEV